MIKLCLKKSKTQGRLDHSLLKMSVRLGAAHWVRLPDHKNQTVI